MKKPSRNRKIGEGTTVFGTPFIKPHFVNLLSLGLGFKIEVTTIKVKSYISFVSKNILKI